MRAVALAALLLLSGCFHFHYLNSGVPPAAAPQDESTHHGFLWGLVESSPPVPLQICPNEFARVDSEETFVNGFLHAVTLSIYTPQTVTVTCSSQGAVPQSPNRPWEGK